MDHRTQMPYNTYKYSYVGNRTRKYILFEKDNDKSLNYILREKPFIMQAIEKENNRKAHAKKPD